MNRLKSVLKVLVSFGIAISIILGTTASVEAATVKHTVTFVYGTKIVQQQVNHGGNAVPPTDTYVPGYNFLSWVGSVWNVTEDRIILGAYDVITSPVIPAPMSPAVKTVYYDPYWWMNY